MFEVMKMISHTKGGYFQNPDRYKSCEYQEIIPLNEQKEDLFLDIFSGDFIKIVRAIDRKKQVSGYNEDEVMNNRYPLI